MVCRSEQKRITRDYLVVARSELQDVLSVLQDLEDKSKELKRRTSKS